MLTFSRQNSRVLLYMYSCLSRLNPVGVIIDKKLNKLWFLRMVTFFLTALCDDFTNTFPGCSELNQVFLNTRNLCGAFIPQFYMGTTIPPSSAPTS